MYQPNINGSLVRTMAEWGQFFKESGKPYSVIELMNAVNSILEEMLWKEATDKDGNRTALRTKLPSVYWRKLYKGIPPSKSSISIVKDPVGILEGRSLIDAKFKDIYGDQFAPYRFGEDKAFSEAMRQELATAIFYGSIKSNPEGIHGLAPRYCYGNGPNVLDAGGTGSDLTSIWLVCWGENETMGIFPEGSMAGLQHKDLGEFDAYDEDGNAFRAIGDLFSWNVGISVRDWRSVARIANIDSTKLKLVKGEAGFIDLNRLTIIAKNFLPKAKLDRAFWYMNRDVMTALELQASDKGNVEIHYGELFNSKDVPMVHFRPVRREDAILNTEEQLPTVG